MHAHALLLLLPAAGAFTCPAYDTLRQDSVRPPFQLQDMQGKWALVAYSVEEPTMPTECGCATETWRLNGSAIHATRHGKPRYGIETTSLCKNILHRVKMSVEEASASRPGFLVETAKTVETADLIEPRFPHMVFDIEYLQNGNVLAFTYACPKQTNDYMFFSFNLLAREREGLTEKQVEAAVAKHAAHVGEGVLDMHNLRFDLESACPAAEVIY
mmetsp:Transcript_14455/g.41213  ORF Transcript_14455/g.41213 Transcript_14455/m.41213 type:complete len:215 (+) Transcript_14455:63-707(+)